MAFLPLFASLLMAAPAVPAAKSKTPPAPVLAYVVFEASPGSAPCDESCFKSAAAKVRGRRGVKKVPVQLDGLVLEIQPGVFRAAEVIRGVDGMKLEMRVPYKTLELAFLPDGPFPPVSRTEGDAQIIETSENAKKAIEAAVNFKLPARLKCFGKLTGPEANEAVLMRYEEEKRPPATMVPFLAEADFDGDKRPDLYLRLEGMPEVVVFGNASGELKAVAVQADEVDALPRCDATPTHFVRPVPKQKVKCMADAAAHAGDAVERVKYNSSSDLLMWSGSKFTTCEPLGEGAMPQVPKPKEGKKPKEDEKKPKKEDDNW